MGLAGSKGLLEASQIATTPTSIRSHIFAVDPRSPSEEFARTPIAYEDDSFETSQFMDDPRSPAIGFNRTPMSLNQSPDKNAIQDPRSPTTEVPRTPLEKMSYNYSEDEENEDEVDDKIVDLVLDPVPVKNGYKAAPLNFKIAEDPLTTTTIDSPTLLKLSKLNLRNNEDIYGESPRSPLAISNRPNSLRIRVQHKMHASKIAASSIGSSGAIISIGSSNNNKQPMRQFSLADAIDKENSPIH